MALEAGACVADALRHARGLGVDRLDATLLLAEVLRRDRSWLIAHGEHALTPEDALIFSGLLDRRADGVPLAYLLGRREFHGLMLRVTPAVLDPRPDTESLVDWALEILHNLPVGSPAGSHASSSSSPVAGPDATFPSANSPNPEPLRVIDLGTGSGAIALALATALKAARPDCEVHATDASTAALDVAQHNANALGLPVRFHAGSWWEAVPVDMRFQVAVSNPPYIRPDDPHLSALVHEPRSALVAAEEGLADLRRVIEGARAHLSAGGWLLLEHGHDQGQAVAQLLHGAGFESIGHRTDLAGHTRCTGGRLAG